MERKNQATIASRIPANDECEMQLQKVQSDDKTQFRVRLPHLANRSVLKRGIWGPTLGVQTGSKSQRNPNAPTLGERSIGQTVRVEEMARKSAWTLHKNVYTIPASYSENRPASNASSPPVRTSQENFIVDSRTSLRMKSKNKLASEKQETVRRSKDPSVMMTATGTKHTTEEATAHVHDLDMFC